MTVEFETNKVYSFNTLAPAILGTQIKNAKLKGVLTYDTAVQFDNVDLKFRQIYPVLPAGTPDQIEACRFFLFQSESGSKIVLADQWIDMATVELIEAITYQITLPGLSVQDGARIRDGLNALGYTGYTLKQI